MGACACPWVRGCVHQCVGGINYGGIHHEIDLLNALAVSARLVGVINDPTRARREPNLMQIRDTIT